MGPSLPSFEQCCYIQFTMMEDIWKTSLIFPHTFESLEAKRRITHHYNNTIGIAIDETRLIHVIDELDIPNKKIHIPNMLHLTKYYEWNPEMNTTINVARGNCTITHCAVTPTGINLISSMPRNIVLQILPLISHLFYEKSE